MKKKCSTTGEFKEWDEKMALLISLIHHLLTDEVEAVITIRGKQENDVKALLSPSGCTAKTLIEALEKVKDISSPCETLGDRRTPSELN